MNILDFIRRNSIIVLIAIAGVGTGLIVMDYAGSSSLFSRDYFFKVGDTNYSYEDSFSLGDSGDSALRQLIFAGDRKLLRRFDANGDDQLDATEQAAQDAWLEQHPDFMLARNLLQMTRYNWLFGPSKSETNIAINRAIIRAEGEELGLRPNRDQIDDYLRSLPFFRNDDGSFDEELYRETVGREANHSSAYERKFRELIADVITWNALCEFYSGDISAHPSTQLRLTDVLFQQFKGKYAWLPASAAQKPAEPTEDELKAFWEQNKNNYKTEERRIVTLYTLTAQDGSMDPRVTEIVLEQAAANNGRGMDELLKATSEDPENPPFTYTKETFPLCTAGELPEGLRTEIPYNNAQGEPGNVSLGDIAFNEVKTAPSPEQYEGAVKSGSPDDVVTFNQVRGPLDHEGKNYILRVEAIEVPTVLSYEDARERALADLRRINEENALTRTGEKLSEEMNKALAEGNVDAAMEIARAAGAEIRDFDTQNPPSNYSVGLLLTSASGKLAPMQQSDEGISLAVVTSRTVVDSNEYRALRAMIAGQTDSVLRQALLRDWLVSAYRRHGLLLSPKAME